ncbi:hypothetical protein ACFVVX_36340 [Kitasatospora sp. NPDC058170]|uniref:hypothetical protein n=1 Tax=Kitasatospora sp. NPDC058170 TaxID=3346364 RepID=UPI0036DF8005
MRQESMLSTSSPNASDGGCGLILDKIEFLLKAQQLADGVDQVEPLLEDLTDQIRDRGSCRPAVAERFLALMQEIDPWSLEVLQYCMHELRWQEVLDRAEDLFRKESGVARRRLYERLLESFEDDWKEREFFRRYSD